MKRISLSILATVAFASVSYAQVGYWSDAGLTPRSPTLYVNTNYNNNSLETGDVTITSNGNVVMGWEDDGNGLTDWEAVWILHDSNGNLVLPGVTITNVPGTPCIADAESVTNCPYRSCFRSDGSPIPCYTIDYGGRVKANMFGDGFAFLGGGDSIACEIPQLAAISLEQGDTVPATAPFVQLVNNDGTPNTAAGGADVAGIRSYSDADTDPIGNVRPGAAVFLSNGNFMLMGESRQVADQAMTGQSSGNVVVYKVFNSTGGVVMPYTNASSEAVAQEVWHGAAAAANGFAIRFNAGGDTIRFFNNNGVPVTINISIAAVTGHPEAATGGRGDGTGFKSNGKDAYVYATGNSTTGPWVTVFNSDGTVRYSRAVTETNSLGQFANCNRLDADISADGRVIVAFDASNNDTNNNIGPYRLTQARILDPCGNPLGPVFYVSETENVTNATADTTGEPRVAWRGNVIAVMWGSKNDPDPAFSGVDVATLRIFTAPAPLGPSVQQIAPGNVKISWTGCGVLQQSSDLAAWADISPTAVSPYSPSPLAAQKFYRLRY